MFFAGFWTPWKGVKKVRDGEREFELYGFLTTSPNEIVSPIHQKAMPTILTTPEEVDLWLTGEWNAVKHLQRPLPRKHAGRGGATGETEGRPSGLGRQQDRSGSSDVDERRGRTCAPGCT